VKLTYIDIDGLRKAYYTIGAKASLREYLPHPLVHRDFDSAMIPAG